MKLGIAAVLAGFSALSLTVPKVIAQTPSPNRLYPSSCVFGEFLKKIDAQALICRNKNPNAYSTPNLKKLDELYLYRYNSQGNLNFSIIMVVYEENSLILVTLAEYNPECKNINCESLSRSTQFCLIRRKFFKWVSNPNNELVEIARKDISALLDTQNQPILNNF